MKIQKTAIKQRWNLFSHLKLCFLNMWHVQIPVLDTAPRGMGKGCHLLAKDPLHSPSSKKHNPRLRTIIIMPTKRTTWKRQNWGQRNRAEEERSKVRSASNIPQTPGGSDLLYFLPFLPRSQLKVLMIFGNRS